MPVSSSRQMVISRWWFQVAILTFAIGVAVLGYLAFRVYDDHPPIPQKVISSDGQALFASADILAEEQIFQKQFMQLYETT